MFLPKFKLKDSEPCPCGSNIRFQECCKGRKPQIIKPSKKPVEVQVMEKMRASMKKFCMHPDQEKCKGPIKGAHALQNNKIISLLAGSERHVYMLNTKKQPLLIPLYNGEVVPIVELSRISANDATTETCFCDYHDNIAFDMSTLFWTYFYRTIYINFHEFVCYFKIIYLFQSRANKLAITRP